jgi:homoserine O-acetyltransferase
MPKPSAPPTWLPVPRPVQVRVPQLLLHSGETLSDVTLTGAAYGLPLGDAPVVVLAGGISATDLPFGDGTHPGWWHGLLRPGLLDPTRCTLLAPASLGFGSTWAGFRDTPWTQLPRLSSHDLANAAELWLTAQDCPQGVTFLGASVGGLTGLALAAQNPMRVRHLIVISAGARPDPWGTGIRHLQRELVRDGLRAGDPDLGMRRARQLGMLTYRGRDEIAKRFGALQPEDRDPPIASYLDHHGQRFVERFHPSSYLVLSDAIDRSHLPRETLARIRARVTVVGVPGDLLFPFVLQEELHRALLSAGVRSQLLHFDAPTGHDAFLADQDMLAELLIPVLDSP